MINEISGKYLGTEINGKWWKRYRKNKILHAVMVNSMRMKEFIFTDHLQTILFQLILKILLDSQSVTSGKWIGLPF
jgi:hypothetical protein